MNFLVKLYRKFFPKPKTMEERIEELLKSIPADYWNKGSPIEPFIKMLPRSKFYDAVPLGIEHGVTFKKEGE